MYRMEILILPETVELIDDERTRYPTPTSRNEEVRFAACFRDFHCPGLIEHEVKTLVRQRVFD